MVKSSVTIDVTNSIAYFCEVKKDFYFATSHSQKQRSFCCEMWQNRTLSLPHRNRSLIRRCYNPRTVLADSRTHLQSSLYLWPWPSSSWLPTSLHSLSRPILWVFVTDVFLEGQVVSLSPNSQPGGPGCLS